MTKNRLKNRIAAIFAVLFLLSIWIGLVNGILFMRVSSDGSRGFDLFANFPGLIFVQFAGSIILILFLLVLLVFLFRSVLNPLYKVKEALDAVRMVMAPKRLESADNSMVSELAASFECLTDQLRDAFEKLDVQRAEMHNKTWELEEANLVLEASHEQLQATIQQLNDAEEKYHSLVRNMPDMVCVTDHDGYITFVNKISRHILGYDKDFLQGKDFYSLLAPGSEKFLLDSVIYRLKETKAISMELNLVRNDGEIITVEAGFTNYIFNEMNMGVQVIIRDITQRKSLEKELIQKNKDLLCLNAMSKKIISHMSLDSLLAQFADEICQGLGYPGCVVSLVDHDGITLNKIAHSGEFFSNSSELPEFKQRDILEETIQKAFEGKTFFKTSEIPSDWTVPIINQHYPDERQIREIAILPLWVKEKKNGILIVCKYTAFTERDEALLSSMANHAVAAIENSLLYETLKKYFIRTIDALIATVEAKDSYTEGHSQRVSKIAQEIAVSLGMSREQVEHIKIAGILHDIGKIGISDSILLKPDKLTEEEYNIVKQHPAIGNKILYPIGFSEMTMKAIAFHHERYDGTGYPFGLKGEEISIEAQIIAVADAFDAMTSNRAYRNAVPVKAAMQELVKNKSTQFSPKVVDAFVEISDTSNED